jgi:cell wall assembly regulator SMI1
MAAASGRELQATLDELDRFIRAEHPALHERFGPGLSDEEIDELAQSLRPYHLPAELVRLYRWHDGWKLLRQDVRVDLLPDADLMRRSSYHSPNRKAPPRRGFSVAGL